MKDTLNWSVRECSARVRAGDVRARELVEAQLEHLELREPSVGAYLRVEGESALSAADAIDDARSAGRPLGPLAGVPMALKDLFVTRGVATTAASRMLETWVPPYHGSQAERMHNAGAVMLGKLQMDEFGMGSSNENSAFGAVRNPWSSEHVPGGSSGGSAAAVASGTCRFALASDTGGSIRQPASFCGVVGCKPSYGRVSRHGMIAFASSFDQAGPITRDVRDAALVLGSLAGHDPRDATCIDAPVPDYSAACDRGLSGMRVGVHRAALESDGLDPAVRANFLDALSACESAGAQLVDVQLPHFRHCVATYYVLSTAEAASNLARYDGVRYGKSVRQGGVVESYEATRGAGFGAEVKRRIMLGTFVLRAESYDAYYGQAMRVRSLIARDYRDAFEHCDVITSPTSPVPAFALGERSEDPLSMYLADIFTTGANLAGLAGISVPSGFDESRADRPLPLGIQFMAPRLGESTMFAAAAGFEATRAPSHSLPLNAQA